MNTKIVIFFLLNLLVFLAYGDSSNPPPQQLLQWKDWILEKHPDIDCPRMGTGAKERRCAWPDLLTIDVDSNGAHFSQTWEVFGNSWLALPGNQRQWPTDVTVEGKSVTLLEGDNRPMLLVKPGRYAIQGKISWNTRPQFLQIPAENALIAVTIDGKPLTWPNIDAKGRLWFKQPDETKPDLTKGDSVTIEIFRRISDGVPITMDTELRLTVSGKPRELLLGRFLLAESVATQFHSDIPARIEQDGLLRIQVRSGTWIVKLSSRFSENISKLTMEKATDDWPNQEIWSFRSAPLTRGVKITGVAGVDPSQLNLPKEWPKSWNKLPTFIVEPKSTFTIEEQYRGDIAPTANQINLNRAIWLDFDSKGATIKDTITGAMSQDWRLSVQPDLQLGRISVNGLPQLVTRMEKDGSEGIEIRQSNLNVEAISRLDDRTRLTATGWQHDINSLQVSLNMPPGWLLWHVAGPDRVRDTWLSRWDLWNLFLCLLIVGATFKLLDWRWAALAVATLGLSYHETNVPLATWVVLIVILPLLNVLPQGRLRKIITNLGYLTLIALAMIVLVFAVQQVRKGLYPQLDQQQNRNRAINLARYGDSRSFTSSVVQTPVPQEKEIRTEKMEMAADAVLPEENKASEEQKQRAKVKKQQRYKPTANTQTGPGEPTWQWNQVTMNWSGPVQAGSPMRLYLSPPWLTRILMFLEVFLVGTLSFGFARSAIRLNKINSSLNSGPKLRPTAGAATAICLFFAVGLAAFTPEDVIADTYPPEYLLREWENRLTEAPECAPNCFAMNSIHITVAGETLQMRMRVGVGTELGGPLPGDKTWLVKQILIDDVVSNSVIRTDGRLWIKLPEGNHDITIEGLIRGDTINIPFIQTPHNVTVDAEGWEIYGLEDKRVPSKSLQLRKREKAVAQDTLLPEPIAPFVKVHRQLVMDLDWNIKTSVTRIAPQHGGITINIPLLNEESVVSENIKIIERDSQRYVAATLGARQKSVTWNSVIKAGPQIEFVAPDTSRFVEVWSAEASPRWHINYQGLTPIKNNHPHTRSTLKWLPWPGERLQLQAIKPEPVAGRTTTIESVLIDTKPGARTTELKLQLTIRSSLGGDFRIEQPDNATLERISIDDIETTKQQEDNIVIIPLHPGLQNISIKWLLGSGVVFNTRTPTLKLGAPASNIDISMILPQSRWPLLVTGPDIGPAMLYWGVLIVILFVAILLGRAIKRFQLAIPVNTWQWILLAIGMSTVNMVGGIFVVFWFFALEARTKLTLPDKRWKFNLMQLILVALTFIAVACLCSTIPISLLSTPDMQITGNGSFNYSYMWYQDNSGEVLPHGQVYSVPISVYRIAMLVWSLWLVFALLRWVKWGWECFSFQQLWMGRKEKETEKQLN